MRAENTSKPVIKSIVDGIAVSIYAVFALFVLVLFPLFTLGPAFESKYFPVVVDYKAEKISGHQFDPQFEWLHVEFNKVRQCKPLDTFEWYIITADGKAIRVDGKSLSPVVNSRPTGINIIPAYRVDAYNYGPFTSQKLVMTYRCHPFWTTLTEINIPIGSE